MVAGTLPDHVQPQGVPAVPEQAVLGDAAAVQQWSLGLHVCRHLHPYLHYDSPGQHPTQPLFTPTACFSYAACTAQYS